MSAASGASAATASTTKPKTSTTTTATQQQQQQPPQTSSSSALIRKRPSDLSLMPPPGGPPVKRIKRPKTVIDEDTYTSALSRIIARDFFPGLLESETQAEYLDALESRDEEWIASAGRRLEVVMTPGRGKQRRRGRRGTSILGAGLGPVGETPRGAEGGAGGGVFGGDTPSSVVSTATSTVTTGRTAGLKGDETLDKLDPVDMNMSLGAFQAKYTSEDNESFYKLLDRQNSKKAEKYAWLWSGTNKLPSKMMLKQREVEMKLVESGRSLKDDGFAKRDRLAIRDRDGEERPAQVETWRAKPDNQLMFAPEGVEDQFGSRLTQGEMESKAPPRAISYQNTRMTSQEQEQQQQVGGDGGGRDDVSVVTSAPSLSAVRDAIAGKRTEARGTTSTAVSGGETPRVNGYAFVDDEEPDYANRSAPPRINLGPGDASPNPFEIKAQPKREALHHRMVDRISQSKRSSSTNGMVGKAGKTPVPKFPSSPRVGGKDFTPAAQRLWSKIEGKGGITPRTPFGGESTPRTKSKLKSMSKR